MSSWRADLLQFAWNWVRSVASGVIDSFFAKWVWLDWVLVIAIIYGLRKVFPRRVPWNGYRSEKYEGRAPLRKRDVRHLREPKLQASSDHLLKRVLRERRLLRVSRQLFEGTVVKSRETDKPQRTCVLSRLPQLYGQDGWHVPQHVGQDQGRTVEIQILGKDIRLQSLGDEVHQDHELAQLWQL